MITTDALLERIDRYLARAKMTDEQFGRVVCKNWRLIPRIRNGGDFKLKAAAQIEEFLRENPGRRAK